MTYLPCEFAKIFTGEDVFKRRAHFFLLYLKDKIKTRQDKDKKKNISIHIEEEYFRSKQFEKNLDASQKKRCCIFIVLMIVVSIFSLLIEGLWKY